MATRAFPCSCARPSSRAPADDALSRPIIGIVNTGSSYNPCHGNAPQLIEAVKRGVMLAGGLPMDFPTISVHESFSQPTSMYLRNLMSMDTEEMIRAQPMDAVVLIGGCEDGAGPAHGRGLGGVPAIQLVTGSMLTGSHRGERVGACTDCRRYWAATAPRRSTPRKSPTSTTSWWPAWAPVR